MRVMEEIHLSFCMTPYDRIQPLITGEVKPTGITLHFVELPVPDLFYHQVKFQRFA